MHAGSPFSSFSGFRGVFLAKFEFSISAQILKIFRRNSIFGSFKLKYSFCSTDHCNEEFNRRNFVGKIVNLSKKFFNRQSNLFFQTFRSPNSDIRFSNSSLPKLGKFLLSTIKHPFPFIRVPSSSLLLPSLKFCTNT